MRGLDQGVGKACNVHMLTGPHLYQVGVKHAVGWQYPSQPRPCAMLRVLALPHCCGTSTSAPGNLDCTRPVMCEDL